MTFRERVAYNRHSRLRRARKKKAAMSRMRGRSGSCGRAGAIGRLGSRGRAAAFRTSLMPRSYPAARRGAKLTRSP